MKITKLEHSGLVIEKDGQNLVFDPVEFTGIIPKIENVAAVVITHKHGDHSGEIRKFPNAKVYISKTDANALGLEGENIILHKYQAACVFCDSTRNIVSFKGRNVCADCIAKLGEKL